MKKKLVLVAAFLMLSVAAMGCQQIAKGIVKDAASRPFRAQ